MKSVLFENLHQWKVCFVAGCKEFGWGLGRIVSCLFLGLLSIIRWLWRLLVKAVSYYPVAAIIIFVVACMLIWILTYASGKAKLVSAENERDTMAFRLQQFEQMYDGNTDSVIVVRKRENYSISFDEQDDEK